MAAEWNFGRFAHGGDYNPDQWRHIPGTWDEDMRLMKKAHCNLMSVGIFSWAALEPEEGKYDFDWLEEILNKLHENGISALLATPSGARPAWMAQKYPEVLRVNETLERNPYGNRHNHCYTSPVYREFTRRIDSELARRFGSHPAVVGWHISNEYGGVCYCPLCQAAFREFLKEKYGTLEELNHAWWTGFWAKTYTDWSQIEAPVPRGEGAVHGLSLDWKRFVTRQTVDFMRVEAEAVRAAAPLPLTTNMMGLYDGLDYFKFQDLIDFSSFDSYPAWGQGDDYETALNAGFAYDLTRCYKDRTKPWILMESTPSQVNWHEVCRLKRPGMHLLASLQAVAHGSDSVMYFQWRKGRGCAEKFHGAVVDHEGSGNSRTFREVTEVGVALEKLAPLLSARMDAPVALIYDRENKWALEDSQGPTRNKRYYEEAFAHYRALKKLSADVDVIDMDQDFTPYRVIVAPMLYMVRPGVAQRLKAFVRSGGSLVCTSLCGEVDENDLCFTGGFPGPLRDLLGVWIEETDALWPDQKNALRFPDGTAYGCRNMCSLIHAETAKPLAVYDSDFYAGQPAFTENEYGEGRAWYVATQTGEDFLTPFYREVLLSSGVDVAEQAEGVLVARRYKDGKAYRFTMNFAGEERSALLPEGRDLLTGRTLAGDVTLAPRSLVVQEVANP